MSQQFGAFIGQFLDYDANFISKGYQNYMRTRVWIDVRDSMKRRKKIALPQRNCIYAQFQYERLLVFCFLCRRLGYSEGFCPVRIVHGTKELPLEWDFSIKGDAPQLGNLGKANDWSETVGQKDIQGHFQNVDFINHVGANLGLNAGGRKSVAIGEGVKVDPNCNLIEEDCPMEDGKGNNRRRNTLSSQVSNELYSGNTFSGQNTGLGNPRAIRCLRHVLREANAEMTFFMEIKRVMIMGDLSLCWKQGRKILLHNFSMHRIDVTVKDEREDHRWRFTGFYGHPMGTLRYQSWELIQRLAEEGNDPWLFMGNFSEI
ncbi:hypothetical protein Godav_000929, partial [Gossypium davidsonii]|nr:hypothetical protein [Gossypium davidsonii]